MSIKLSFIYLFHKCACNSLLDIRLSSVGSKLVFKCLLHKHVSDFWYRYALKRYGYEKLLVKS